MIKKKIKLKKRVKIILVLAILGIIGIIFGIHKYKEYLYHQTYEYKLMQVGYSMEEAHLLENNLDTDHLNKYLEENRNDTIIGILNEKYYIKDNLDRYLNYISNNKKTSIKDTITIVNVNRDYDYYELNLNTDTSKTELMLVNKYYGLDESYNPDDLVNISNLYSWGSGHKTRQITYDAFLNMWNAAYEDGLYLMINSSFRTYAEQKQVYDNYINLKGEKYADSIAARPGHSEHETGLCLDIFSKTNTNKSTFKDTEDYEWLKNNAYKYGFIIRYPEGKENITGYTFESWHYRYVGLEIAKFIHENDITYDEYYAYFIEK